MKKSFYKFPLLLLLVCFLLVACHSGPKTPDGMPSLYPCTLTVMQNDSPVTGAVVQLIPESGDGGWAVGGTTNDTGVVQIITHGQFPGAPKGNYKLTVSKTEVEDNGPKDNPDDHRIYTITTYALTNPKYASAETTTLSVSVEGKTNKTIELDAFERKVLESRKSNEI